MPIMTNVTLGNKIQEGVDAGEIEFNSLDETLDFDELAKQITGNEEMTWDAHIFAEEQEERTAKARSEEKEAERKEKAKKELSVTIEELGNYSYGKALEEYADPEKVDELGVQALKEALEVIKACEAGEKPKEVMDRLEIEEPGIIMSLIARISKKGPELYKTYIGENGISIEDLDKSTQKRFKEIEERNERYDAEEERQKGFGETLAKVTDDVEFSEFVEVEQENATEIKQDRETPEDEEIK